MVCSDVGVLLTATCLVTEMCELNPDTVSHFRRVSNIIMYLSNKFEHFSKQVDWIPGFLAIKFFLERYHASRITVSSRYILALSFILISRLKVPQNYSLFLIYPLVKSCLKNFFKRKEFSSHFKSFSFPEKIFSHQENLLPQLYFHDHFSCFNFSFFNFYNFNNFAYFKSFAYLKKFLPLCGFLACKQSASCLDCQLEVINK